MAFIDRTSKRGKKYWRIVWQDATKGAGRAGRREANCTSGDHDEAFGAKKLEPEERAALANGATNPALRAALLQCYEALEVSKAREAARAEATGILPAFATPLADFVAAYEKAIEYRVKLKAGERGEQPPDFGWRLGIIERGITSRAGDEILRTLRFFREWMPAGLTTGTLTSDHLRQFLAAMRAKRNISSRSANKYRAHLSVMFGAINRRARKRYFRDDPTLWFAEDVETLPESRPEIITYTPADVTAFFEAAERMGDPNRVMKVERRKKHSRAPLGKKESFVQRPSVPPAPVLQWAMLLACTGVRRGEAERLRWNDVDLEHGVIKVFSTKTTAFRYVPLTGDPAGDVSPGFAEVLREWRKRRPDDVYVLPSANGEPCYPQHAWEAVNDEVDARLTAQGLRRTFESMLAAIGFPASLAAFWLGHSVQVAESNYRAYRPGRLPGSTIEAALGLTPFLDREARGQATLRLLPKAVGDETTGGDAASTASADGLPPRPRGRGRRKPGGKKT